MPYIEREYLIEQFEDLFHNDNIMNPVIKVLDAIEIIDTAPSADVVNVVRCKDCKYQEDCARQMVHTTRDYVLEQNISSYNKVDFCSCAKLKERKGK